MTTKQFNNTFKKENTIKYQLKCNRLEKDVDLLIVF